MEGYRTHKECPEHGQDVGIAFSDTCGHYDKVLGARRCGRELVEVRYVRESELKGAVDENERLRAVIRDMKSLMPIVRRHAEQVIEWADATLDQPGGR